MKYSAWIFILLLFQLNLFGQQHVADSLEKVLVNLEGNNKVDTFNKLADIYQVINPQIARKYAEKSIELANKISYKKGLASAYGSLGFCYINQDNDKAKEYTRKALAIRYKINDEPGIATSLNVMGVIFYYEGDYLTAIDYQLKAIKLREELGDKLKIAVSYNNLALIFIKVGDFEQALDYLHKALNIRVAANNKRGIGITKTNFGEVYSLTGQTEKAFKYFYEGLEANKETGNKGSEANSYYNLAGMYYSLGDTKNALANYNSSLQIYNDLEESNGMANVQNGIATLYKSNGDVQKAFYHSNIAIRYANRINSYENISKASDILQFCYKEMGRYDSAYKYISLFHNSNEYLKSNDKLKKLAKIELDFKINKLRQDQEAELTKQRNFIQFLLIILFFSVIVVLLIVRGSRLKKKTNIQLNKLNTRLKELNSTKDRFFSIIAHDLRGPFQSFLSSSELLAKEIESLDKEEIKTLSSDLNISLNKQFDLLNDLLEWSKLQSGNFRIIPQSIKIFDVVNQIFEQFRFASVKKGIKLQNKINPEISIYADLNMILLVFRNLISNSIKFTKPGGMVEITAEREENNVLITVNDNGVGISEKDLQSLFKIDSVHSTEGTANEAGSGLGLILCKEIIEKHNGSLLVKSELNKGSKFIFTMPASLNL